MLDKSGRGAVKRRPLKRQIGLKRWCFRNSTSDKTRNLSLWRRNISKLVRNQKVKWAKKIIQPNSWWGYWTVSKKSSIIMRRPPNSSGISEPWTIPKNDKRCWLLNLYTWICKHKIGRLGIWWRLNSRETCKYRTWKRQRLREESCYKCCWKKRAEILYLKLILTLCRSIKLD